MHEGKDEHYQDSHAVAVSTGTIFRTLIILLLVAFLYFIRDIVAVFAVALFLAALLDPLADWLERFHIPRGLGVIVVYVVLAGVLAGALVLVAPPMLSELGELVTRFAPYIERVSNGSIHLGALQNAELTSGFEQFIATVRASGVEAALPQILDAGSAAFGALFASFLVLILTFYLVVEKTALVRLVGFVSPAHYHPFLVRIATKMREKTGAWLRGELLLMLAVFIMTYIALLLLGIPFALVLALTAGLMEVIPFLGPMISVVPAVILALGVSPIHAILTALAYLVVQQTESNVLVPKIMQKTTGLNPIVSLVAVLIGFRLGGIVGAMLSIPLAMAMSVFLEEVFKNRDDV